MAETSTTETGVDQSSSGSQNESLLDDNQQVQTADEQHEDTGSGDSQSQDSGRSTSSDENEDDGSDDVEGLAKFAKGQGIDNLDDLTEREKKLLKVARDNQRDFHAKRVQDSDEARRAMETVHQPDENDELTAEERITNQMAYLMANQRRQDFYTGTPDAKDYDKEMAEVLVEEAQTYGRAAAQALAQNMPRLYREAKARRGDNDSEAAREAGRREERNRLRKSQDGAGETASASNSSSSSSKKLTRETVAAMSDKEYAERRDEIDAAIVRGDLY